MIGKHSISKGCAVGLDIHIAFVCNCRLFCSPKYEYETGSVQLHSHTQDAVLSQGEPRDAAALVYRVGQKKHAQFSLQ